MTFLILLLIAIVCIGIFLHCKEKSDYNKYLKEAEIETDAYAKKLVSEINAHKQHIESLSIQYGSPDFDECIVLPIKTYESLSDGILDKHYSHISVFEKVSKIIIDEIEYDFVDILGYSIVDNTTGEATTTSTGTAKTSTGSMIGRAIVGGVLTGGLGAVAGAATAKKNITNKAITQTATTHNYTLYLNVNNIQSPMIILEIGDKASTAQKIAGVINVIIERNKN